MNNYKVSDLLFDPTDGAMGVIIKVWEENHMQNMDVLWFNCKTIGSTETSISIEDGGFEHHSC